MTHFARTCTRISLALVSIGLGVAACTTEPTHPDSEQGCSGSGCTSQHGGGSGNDAGGDTSSDASLEGGVTISGKIGVVSALFDGPSTAVANPTTMLLQVTRVDGTTESVVVPAGGTFSLTAVAPGSGATVIAISDDTNDAAPALRTLYWSGTSGANLGMAGLLSFNEGSVSNGAALVGIPATVTSLGAIVIHVVDATGASASGASGTKSSYDGSQGYYGPYYDFGAGLTSAQPSTAGGGLIVYFVTPSAAAAGFAVPLKYKSTNTSSITLGVAADAVTYVTLQGT